MYCSGDDADGWKAASSCWSVIVPRTELSGPTAWVIAVPVLPSRPATESRSSGVVDEELIEKMTVSDEADCRRTSSSKLIDVPPLAASMVTVVPT